MEGGMMRMFILV